MIRFYNHQKSRDRKKKLLIERNYKVENMKDKYLRRILSFALKSCIFKNSNGKLKFENIFI